MLFFSQDTFFVSKPKKQDPIRTDQITSSITALLKQRRVNKDKKQQGFQTHGL